MFNGQHIEPSNLFLQIPQANGAKLVYSEALSALPGKPDAIIPAQAIPLFL